MMNILEITPKAQKKIKILLEKANLDNLAGIRVGVKSGGCSGFKYYIEYAQDIHKYDEVIKLEDASIIIDPKALLYIMGTKMDYIEQEFSEGFVFENPNEKGKCGCGKSFIA
ncbi:MAG: iron-sulfur cluster assembly accessory protein [Rickettsia sp.]|nr:iron-sulfur cluster assembly accessory protein [Rickettsia sp.]